MNVEVETSTPSIKTSTLLFPFASSCGRLKSPANVLECSYQGNVCSCSMLQWPLSPALYSLPLRLLWKGFMVVMAFMGDFSSRRDCLALSIFFDYRPLSAVIRLFFSLISHVSRSEDPYSSSNTIVSIRRTSLWPDPLALSLLADGTLRMPIRMSYVSLWRRVRYRHKTGLHLGEALPPSSQILRLNLSLQSIIREVWEVPNRKPFVRGIPLLRRAIDRQQGAKANRLHYTVIMSRNDLCERPRAPR